VSAAADTGTMTVGTAAVGASCEYANSENGGLDSPAATSPYVKSNHFCAANPAKFAGGAGCGECFEVTYGGSGGTNPGMAGSAVVQVVNSADAVDFTCHVDVFKAITGASTGQFPVSFKPVRCDVASDRGVATILDGNNAYFTKAIFSDLPHAVASAQIEVDGLWFSMNRLGGATFVSSLSGGTGGVSFKLTLSDGSTVSLNSCFSSWPVSTGSSCTPGGSSPPSPSPTPAVCTAWNEDPYATGAHVSCCDGLNEQLSNWDGDGNMYFKCRQANTLGGSAEISWQEYKDQYGFAFNSGSEDDYRKGVFEQNMAFIDSENAQGHSYVLGVTPFTLRTPDEMSMMKGLKRRVEAPDLPALEEVADVEEVASSLDWRGRGILNEIKNQGSCGSCWTFSAVGVVEAHWAMKTTKLEDLAEQQLLSCSGAGSCGGGDEWEAIEWYAGSGRRRSGSKHGACTTSSYSYSGRDSSCQESSCSYGVPQGAIGGYTYGSKSDSSMITFLNKGPVSSGVYASSSSWDNYNSGVVDTSCGGRTQDHAIVVVGYTSTTYIIRNSWGKRWGESGHINLKRGVSGDGASCILQWEPMQPTISMAVVV